MTVNQDGDSALGAVILQAPEVASEDVLSAREKRVDRVRGMLRECACPVVSFTLNIPGPHKAHALAEKAFWIGQDVLFRQFRGAGIEVLRRVEIAEKTGFEGTYAVSAEAAVIKDMALRIEEEHPLGRIFDIDVAGMDGIVLRGSDAGRGERSCIVCGGPVWACARNRAHSAKELSVRAAGMIQEYLHREYADHVAELATRALLYEVLVSPKPGLVDRRNNGAHRDMDLFTFAASAAALTPYFRDMAARGLSVPIHGDLGLMLPRLRVLGVAAERRMFAATGGVNTHKGLVFSMGIFCVAAGVVRVRDGSVSVGRLLDVCAAIAAETPGEFGKNAENTHGREAYRRFGLTGVRGEAAAGYPNVRLHGFPVFQEMTARGRSLNDAGVAALLHLMAHAEDTNIASRADAATLAGIQAEIGEFLAGRPEMPEMLRFAEAFDWRFIEQDISPGGSADLLALIFFLHWLGAEET